MLKPPKDTKAPDIERKSILDWLAGTVTDYDARRIVDNAVKATSNMVIEQNGVIRPRPSLVEYGPPLLGTVLGEVYECKVMSNGSPTYYLVCVQNVSGTANAYYARGEDTEWTMITGKTYDSSASCHFMMVASKVLVMNGTDNLSYIDPTTWTITTYTALEDPENAPAATKTGLDGTDFQVYYAVSANSTVGETAVSPTVTVQVSTERAQWNPDTQKVTITWDAVQDAVSYNVYLGVTTDGASEAVLYSIADNLDPNILMFVDNGTRSQNLLRPKNTYNSTAGPKTTRGTVVNGRPWMVGDKDNPYHIWFGGDAGHELDFSPSNGGGWTTVASGTKEVPISIKPFRRGTGDNTIVVLTQGSNGSGRRYHLSPQSVSYGNETFVMWSSSEDGGSEGTDSPDAVVFYNNSLYYPSRSGFRTTGTMPQLQNVLSTKDISASIKDQVKLLNVSSLDKAVGLVWEDRIYWSVAVGSERNNRVWVFDLGHNGAWLLSWYLEVDWMTLYNDNSGDTHFLMLCDNKLYETTRLFNSTDYGEPFETEIVSGDIAFSKDVREWARLIQVVFTFLKPKGNFDIQITAHTEDGDEIWTEHVKSNVNGFATGWGEARQGWSSLRGWSEIIYNASAYEESDDILDVMVEIDEDVQWFTYRISSTEEGVDYSISSIVAEYVPIGIKDLS